MPGSSVHGILQSRILEGVAMPSSRGSSQPWMEHVPPALHADALLLSQLRSPISIHCSMLIGRFRGLHLVDRAPEELGQGFMTLHRGQ